MKRLALLLDGTWNTVKSQTNVTRLAGCIADRDGDVVQHVLYDPGVGTEALQWLRGGAFGYGLGKNVAAAYQWLVDRYDEGDEIYVFGFSRGAYTARSVAGMIAKCGLLRRESDLDAKTLFDRYQLDRAVRPIYTLEWIASQGGRLSPEEKTVLKCSRRVPVKMIAVWDTVGALGIPFGNIPGLSRRKHQFHHTRLSNLYEHAYQALAIDEHRKAFEPTLWTRFEPKARDPETGMPTRSPKVEQRWFVGAHADVGGGNPTSLPALALAWIAGKAREAGLKLDPPVPAPGAGRGPITNSFGKFMFGIYKLFKLGRPFVRTIQAERVEKDEGWVETVEETIDGSVFERIRADPSYRPQPVMAWAAARGLDPVKLRGDVEAEGGRAIGRSS